VGLCALLIIVNFSSFILTLIQTEGLSWLGTCFYLVGAGTIKVDQENAAFLLHHGTSVSLMAYFFQLCAWGFCLCLEILEYRRRLSEVWYAQWTFWIVNFIFEALTLFLFLGRISPVTKVFSIIEITSNALLLFLVFKTIKRTRKNLRPLSPLETPLLADTEYYDDETNNRKNLERPSKFPRFRVKIDDFKIKICSSLSNHQE
jgi:hypothetical protein